MTEERLIHGSYGEQRYLHSYEIFCKERNWNMNLPSEREFKDGYCIVTDKDDTAYSIDELVELLNEFQKENEQLKSENKRLTDKLNKTALELVDGVISQGKATEISEMSYREFLDYRAKNGKPMELQK
ncbi:MAG: hypothetical protein IKF11_06635 [Methanobrevibacter sp.]|nr:hypothetical protein [Methanobrevibacter sp.]